MTWEEPAPSSADAVPCGSHSGVAGIDSDTDPSGYPSSQGVRKLHIVCFRLDITADIEKNARSS